MAEAKRGADLLVQSLAAAGVRRLFSLSGNQIMPVFDACLSAGIDIVHTRHEAAAVFMADAYAQTTGLIGVALVTAGPGAANATGALFAARLSESPVLLLTGDSPLAQDGQGAFQELDQVSMTKPLTKLSSRATAAPALGDDIARAIRTALSGRPGPVHLALPADVLEADASGGHVPPPSSFVPTPVPLSPADLDGLAAALRSALHPLILTGPALDAARTDTLAARLADAIAAPVLNMQSPRGLGDPSLGAFADALKQADLVVSLGKCIDFSLNFGRTTDPSCRWIIVDADPTAITAARRNLGSRPIATHAADPRAVAEQLTAIKSPLGQRAEWRGAVKSLCAKRHQPATSTQVSPLMTSTTLVETVQRHVAATANPIVICDGGEFGQWAQAGISATRRIINGPSGAIGGGPCYGIGAKAADPTATVFLLMGDGTAGFHLAEFETAARHGLPFVAIIGNDQRWNAEHQIQLRRYGAARTFGCTLSAMRYDLAVAAMGGHGEFVTDPAELDAALHRAIASNKPACLDVRIEGPPFGGG